MATRLRRTIQRLNAPQRWKIRTRRVFLVTFPLSAPLWLFAMFVGNSAIWLEDLGYQIGAFWSAPPRRIRSYRSTPYRIRERLPGRTGPRAVSDSDRDTA